MSTSPDRGARSASKSPPPKSASRSPRQSRSRSRSPKKRNDSRSAPREKHVSPKRNSRSPDQRPGSRSPLATKTSRSPSPKTKRNSRSPSPKHKKNSRSPSPKKRRGSRSPTPKRRRNSPSPKKRRSTRSPSPRRRRSSRSASPKRRSDRRRGRSGSGSRSPRVTEEPCKLYIGNLSFKTKERDLEDAFRRYGKITDVFIPMETDRDGYQRSRGFAFVTFDREKDADDAVDGMDDGDLQGRQIKVNKAKAREPGEGGARATFARNGREVCRDYERGSCNRGDSCRFAHGSRSRSRERRRRSRSRSRGRDRRR